MCRSRSAILFRETIVDRYELGTNPTVDVQTFAALVSLHELGNIWGLTDIAENGPIMVAARLFGLLDGDATPVSDFTFSGTALRRIVNSDPGR